MGKVGDIWADAKLIVDKASFSEYSSMLKQSEAQMSGISDSAKAVVSGAMLGTAAAVTGVAAYGASIAASYEDANLTLKTLYGSQELAQQKFEWLANFAASTPFEFPELLDATVKLKAYGIEATDYLGVLGDTASAMNKTVGDAVEALADAQTGEFERLKEFGVKAVQITKDNAEQLGASIDDVGKTALTYTDKNGKELIKVVDRNSREMITAALVGVDGIFTKYEGAMEERSHSLNGMISTIKDNLKAGLVDMIGFDMSTGLAEAGSLYSALQGLAGIALSVTGNLSKMSEPMQTFVILATLGGTAALTLAGGVMAAQLAGISASAVMGALGVAVNTVLWPAALVVGTLALVAAGLIYLDEKTGLVTYSWRLLKDLFTITADGIMKAAGILRDYIVEKVDEIKTALADMIPDGWGQTLGRIVDGITGQFSSMGENIHSQAEEIKQDNENVGTSTENAGNVVTTATNQMITDFTGAGGAATTLAGNINGVSPAITTLSTTENAGVLANQTYAASFIDVSTQANAAASSAISASSRIGSAIKTSIEQVGQLEALAGKWNTRAKLGITSSGGSGTGEGSVKVIAAKQTTTLTKTDSKSQNGWSVTNYKIGTINNNGTSTSKANVKKAGV